MMNLQVLDRLIEIPYRVLPTSRPMAKTWCVTASELARVEITWPSEYQWIHANTFTDTLKRSLNRIGVVRVASLAQPHRGIVRLLASIDDRAHVVIIDYSDNEERIDRDALAQCSLYIKFQHRTSGYGDYRIVPGGYPVSSQHYYRYFRSFRNLASSGRRIDVLGRFSYKFQGELRAKAVEMLSNARDIHFVGAGKRVRYSRFLREIACARLSLDLPGNGPFTFRVPEFLGLGTCLISPCYRTKLHEPLLSGVHYVAVADDLSDLLETCRYYLAHEGEREEIARAGREYFDRFLHSDHVASYYLRTMLDRLGTFAEPGRLQDGAALDHIDGVGIPNAEARDQVAEPSIGIGQ